MQGESVVGGGVLGQRAGWVVVNSWSNCREFVEGWVFKRSYSTLKIFQKKGNFISEGLKSGGGMCWGVDLFLKGGEAVEEGLG